MALLHCMAVISPAQLQTHTGHSPTHLLLDIHTPLHPEVAGESRHHPSSPWGRLLRAGAWALLSPSLPPPPGARLGQAAVECLELLAPVLFSAVSLRRAQTPTCPVFSHPCPALG